MPYNVKPANRLYITFRVGRQMYFSSRLVQALDLKPGIRFEVKLDSKEHKLRLQELLAAPENGVYHVQTSMIGNRLADGTDGIMIVDRELLEGLLVPKDRTLCRPVTIIMNRSPRCIEFNYPTEEDSE